MLRKTIEMSRIFIRPFAFVDLQTDASRVADFTSEDESIALGDKCFPAIFHAETCRVARETNDESKVRLNTRGKELLQRQISLGRRS